MQTLIRQATLDDKEAIWKFFEVAYGDHAKDKFPDRWNWLFLENPQFNANGKVLPIFIAVKNDQIVGHVCATLSQIQIGEEIHRVAAGGDLIVLPNCRGEGIAQKLIQEISQHYQVYYTIACGNNTRRILDRIDHFHKFESIPTYYRFVKLDRESIFNFLMKKTDKLPRLKRIAKFGCRLWLDKMISTIANFLIEIRDVFERLTKKQLRSEIKEINTFDPEIDQLWETVKSKYKIILKRDQQFLNWRFSDTTNLHYRRYVLRRDDHIRGYIVVRKPDPVELNIGIIVDLLADPDDNETIESLIGHAIEFFGKRVQGIECPISHKDYQRALSKSGFYKIEETVPLFSIMNPSLKTKIANWENAWFITKADQDWDQLRPMRELNVQSS